MPMPLVVVPFVVCVILLSTLKPNSAFSCRFRKTKFTTVLPHPTIAWTDLADKETKEILPERNKSTTKQAPRRRSVLVSLLNGIVFGSLGGVKVASAEITDETEIYANRYPDSSYALVVPSSPTTQQPEKDRLTNVITDEMSFTLTPEEIKEFTLGIELADISFQSNSRVYVRSVKPQSIAEREGIRPNFIVVSVNGKSTERTNAAGVRLLIQQALSDTTQPLLVLVLRDPSIFSKALSNLQLEQTATTQVAPAGRTSTAFTEDLYNPLNTQTDQRITVTQLLAPKKTQCVEANIGDLLEIMYTASAIADDPIMTSMVDGSTISVNGKGIPGRGGDLSLFFVLGKQPAGQFPPGWDVGLKGMCIGERRRILIPPVL